MASCNSLQLTLEFLTEPDQKDPRSGREASTEITRANTCAKDLQNLHSDYEIGKWFQPVLLGIGVRLCLKDAPRAKKCPLDVLPRDGAPQNTLAAPVVIWSNRNPADVLHFCVVDLQHHTLLKMRFQMLFKERAILSDCNPSTLIMKSKNGNNPAA